MKERAAWTARLVIGGIGLALALGIVLYLLFG